MIIIRFPNMEHKRRAIGYLTGRFSYTTWKCGQMMVPEEALGALAVKRVQFTVEGPATYDQLVPQVRDSAAALSQ
jgi:hypothetical protein